MQKEPKDSFPSDTRKNPRDCIAVILRSGKELDERRGEKRDIEEEKQVEIGEELLRKRKQQKCSLISRERRNKLKLTILQFHSLKDCRKQS